MEIPVYYGDMFAALGPAMTFSVLAVLFGMAYSEGANDVSKVVATLVGSGLTSYRKAILFGTVCTAVGALAAILLAQGVAVTLTKGIISSSAEVNEAFAIAALVGTILWMLIATRVAMPVSTSHAIVGSIIILGVFVFGPDQVRWEAVWGRVFLPMVASPLIAIPLALALFLVIRPFSQSLPLTALHWISAGAASFARGLNDAPKIVALGAFFYLLGRNDWSSVPAGLLFAVVAIGMAMGSLISGQRVTETLAERVTAMDHVEGLAANATTAFLLIFASYLGLPASVTYVISSSIIGLGIRRAIGDVYWRTVGRMALAWLVTLPCSGILANACYLFIHPLI